MEKILLVLAMMLPIVVLDCASSDDRDGLDRLNRTGADRSNRPGSGPGSGRNPNSFDPRNQTGGGDKSRYTPKVPPGDNNENSKEIEFRIPEGTGNGPWNTKDLTLELFLGDTLVIINDDAVLHRLHTNGSPCPHGSPIPPGGRFVCPLEKLFDPNESGPLYDHDAGPEATFYLRVQEKADSRRDSGGESQPPEWESVKRILSISCGGGACHSSGSSWPVLVDQREIAEQMGDQIVSRMNDTDAPMPPITSGRNLSQADKDLLSSYFQ